VPTCGPCSAAGGAPLRAFALAIRVNHGGAAATKYGPLARRVLVSGEEADVSDHCAGDRVQARADGNPADRCRDFRRLPARTPRGPRDDERRQVEPPGRAAHPDGAAGGNVRERMAEYTTMVAGLLPHGTPDARRSGQGDMPGHETVCVRDDRAGGVPPSARAGACPVSGGCRTVGPQTAARKQAKPGGGCLSGHYA